MILMIEVQIFSIRSRYLPLKFRILVDEKFQWIFEFEGRLWEYYFSVKESNSSKVTIN